MSTIKSSIFKQKVFEKRYEKFYKQDICANYGKLLEEKEIFRCDMKMPQLRVGDKFYIEELDLVVKIKDIVRTSTDKVLYFINDSVIDTDESLKQKEAIEEEIRIYKELVVNEKLKKEEDYKKALDAYNSKSKLYKFFVQFDKF